MNGNIRVSFGGGAIKKIEGEYILYSNSYLLIHQKQNCFIANGTEKRTNSKFGKTY
jgi:hypothetical protein